jgi:nucleotide-binding universal stress UspA family protein
MSSISRILAATDFSAAGHAALARAGQLAAQYSAELHVIHATPDWTLFSTHSAMHQDHYDDITKNAETLLKQEVSWLLAEFAVHANGEIQRGKASQTIVRAADTFRPNLVVIGTRGEHAPTIAPAALGGTTMKLLTQIKLPLLLVREAVATPYKTCLAAIGNSTDQSRRIVHWARSLAKGGDCHVVRTYEVPYLERLRLVGVSAGAIAACSHDAELAARFAADPPWSEEGGGARIHMHLVRGMPVATVLTEVTRYSPQFVAVGRHEGTALEPEHPLMGCVGMRLAYHCPVDVLIVP